MVPYRSPLTFLYKILFDCVFSEFLPYIYMVPEFSDIYVPDCIPTHTENSEIPVHEVEKYRYRFTGFDFGSVQIGTHHYWPWCSHKKIRGPLKFESESRTQTMLARIAEFLSCAAHACLLLF
jgi:hypothetical protein